MVQLLLCGLVLWITVPVRGMPRDHFCEECDIGTSNVSDWFFWKQAVEVLSELYQDASEDILKDTLEKLERTNEMILMSHTQSIKSNVSHLLRSLIKIEHPEIVILEASSEILGSDVNFKLSASDRKWWTNAQKLIDHYGKKEWLPYCRIHRRLIDLEGLSTWEETFKTAFLFLMEKLGQVAYKGRKKYSYVVSTSKILFHTFDVLTQVAFKNDESVSTDDLFDLFVLNFKGLAEVHFTMQLYVIPAIVKLASNVSDTLFIPKDEELDFGKDFKNHDAEFWKEMIAFLKAKKFSRKAAKSVLLRNPYTMDRHERLTILLTWIVLDRKGEDREDDGSSIVDLSSEILKPIVMMGNSSSAKDEELITGINSEKPVIRKINEIHKTTEITASVVTNLQRDIENKETTDENSTSTIISTSELPKLTQEAKKSTNDIESEDVSKERSTSAYRNFKTSTRRHSYSEEVNQLLFNNIRKSVSYILRKTHSFLGRSEDGTEMKNVNLTNDTIQDTDTNSTLLTIVQELRKIDLLFNQVITRKISSGNHELLNNLPTEESVQSGPTFNDSGKNISLG